MRECVCIVACSIDKVHIQGRLMIKARGDPHTKSDHTTLGFLLILYL
jgi:hypothetical protein